MVYDELGCVCVICSCFYSLQKDQLILLELEMKKHKEKLEESSLEIKRGKTELAGTVRTLEGRIA